MIISGNPVQTSSHLPVFDLHYFHINIDDDARKNEAPPPTPTGEPPGGKFVHIVDLPPAFRQGPRGTRPVNHPPLLSPPGTRWGKD